MSGPEYIVGIDLGTTHCALAYAALAEAKKRGPRAVKSLLIDQLVIAIALVNSDHIPRLVVD